MASGWGKAQPMRYNKHLVFRISEDMEDQINTACRKKVQRKAEFCRAAIQKELDKVLGDG